MHHGFEGSRDGASVESVFWCSESDAAYAQSLAAGAIVLHEPHDSRTDGSTSPGSLTPPHSGIPSSRREARHLIPLDPDLERCYAGSNRAANAWNGSAQPSESHRNGLERPHEQSDPMPSVAHVATPRTGLSRRRSRVRVPSLPFLDMPANWRLVLSARTATRRPTTQLLHRSRLKARYTDAPPIIGGDPGEPLPAEWLPPAAGRGIEHSPVERGAHVRILPGARAERVVVELLASRPRGARHHVSLL